MIHKKQLSEHKKTWLLHPCAPQLFYRCNWTLPFTLLYIRNQERIIAISKTSCVSALNYHHENNYLFSWKEIFFFAKRNNYFHEKNSLQTISIWRKNFAKGLSITLRTHVSAVATLSEDAWKDRRWTSIREEKAQPPWQTTRHKDHTGMQGRKPMWDGWATCYPS